MEPHADLKQLLLSTRVRELVPPGRKLVCVPHTATIAAVLDVLSEHAILSAPVFVGDGGDGGVPPTPSIARLLGFVDVWAVLAAFLGTLPPGPSTAAQLEAHGKALGARPVTSLFGAAATAAGGGGGAGDNSGGGARAACADWELFDDPDASLLEVVRSCFLPRPGPGGASALTSWASGAGFSGGALGASPRAAAAGPLAEAPAGGGGLTPAAPPSPPPTAPFAGPFRHPAASHRVVVAFGGGGTADQQLAVLSQSDVLRFLAKHHESLRPLGKASLNDLGLATGSLYLAAGPVHAPGSNHGGSNHGGSNHGGSNHGGSHHGASPRPPPLSPPPPVSVPAAGAAAAAAAGGGGGAGGAPVPPPSPKPPLPSGGLYGSSPGGGGGGGAFGTLCRAGSSGNGPAPMAVGGMSPPPSPRLLAAGAGFHASAFASSLSGGGSSAAAAAAAGLHHGRGSGAPGGARRQLVAVHDSVPALEAFRVLLQQRVSAVAVLSGAGPSAALMRLTGNLSASDLRHLRAGGFGRLALSVSDFLATKPQAPLQAIELAPPPGAASCADGGGSSGGHHPPPPPPRAVVMAHAPGVYTAQATATLEELVRMIGAPGRGIHRVYVADPDTRPAGVVTGTDVLALLSAACGSC